MARPRKLLQAMTLRHTQEWGEAVKTAAKRCKLTKAEMIRHLVAQSLHIDDECQAATTQRTKR